MKFLPDWFNEYLSDDPGHPSGRLKTTAITDLERQIEKGKAYTFTEELNFAASEIKYLLLRTPADKVVKIKNRIISSDGGFRYVPQTGSTFVLGSEILKIVNLKGAVGNGNGTDIYNVESVSVEGSGFDVVRNPNGQGGQASPGTYGDIGSQRELVPATDYLLKFENTDTNNGIYIVYTLIFTEEPI